MASAATITNRIPMKPPCFCIRIVYQKKAPIFIGAFFYNNKELRLQAVYDALCVSAS
jgi:hypothetical protein